MALQSTLATGADLHSHQPFLRQENIFRAAISAPDAPGSGEVADVFVRLAEMPAGSRPFRTPVSAGMEQLLGGYNATADALRPVVAEIFNVVELADAPQPSRV